MAQYPTTAALRRALSSDDPDRRADAYGAVMQHDVEPAQILADPPDTSAVSSLVEADVLDEETSSDDMTTVEWREEVLDVLNTIADNTGGA